MSDKVNYLQNPAVNSFKLQLKELILSKERLFILENPSIKELSFLDFADQYHYKRKSLKETQAELTPLMDDMQKALREKDDSTMLSRCLRTLIWGNVTNSHSVNWLVKEFDNKTLVTKLSAGLSALLQDNYSSLEIFHKNDVRSDSALTKVYALLNTNSVIADGRVLASMCLIAKASLESIGYKYVVKELDFTVDKSNKSKRDPGTEQFQFSKKETGYRHALANLHTNWLLGAVASDPEIKTKLQVTSTEEAIRKIEAGLFMIGKDISKVTLKIPKLKNVKNITDAQEDQNNCTIVPAQDSVKIAQTNRGYTNGPKNTPFLYSTSDTSLSIDRGKEFQTNTEFTGEELINILTNLDREFGDGHFYLANNLSTINLDNAMRGLGKTIFESTADVSEAQAASQLAPLFVSAGVFQWNGAKIGAMYCLNNIPHDWQELRALIDEVEWPLPTGDGVL